MIQSITSFHMRIKLIKSVGSEGKARFCTDISISLRSQKETALNSDHSNEEILMKGQPTEVLAGSGEST